ncbi:MAG TPA: autotransporter-associated beta strand repeat-containing protein [Tepidisphaeraceae bacterium]
MTFSAALAAVVVPIGTARAVVWVGTGTASWNSTGSPGWNGSVAPNGIGHVAEGDNAGTSQATQDLSAPVTLGRIEKISNDSTQWTISLANSIILNQDGAGSGSAIIRNSNTSNSLPQLQFTGLAGLTLADNLQIISTSPTLRTAGAIAFNTPINGSGSITIRNDSNSTAFGQIAFSGTNTFVGAVKLEKGAVTFNNVDAFTTALNVGTNTFTLGSSGGGHATLVSSAALNASVRNNITVAANSGGALVLGSISTGASGFTDYSGTITLDGDLQLTSAHPAGGANSGRVTLSNTISGAGSLLKVGPGVASLTGANNNYLGGTTITAGTLNVSNAGALGSGPVKLARAANAVLGLGSALTIHSLADSDGIGGPIVSAGGSGYATGVQPLVINGGGGSGAAGFATITSGAVTNVTITDFGTGYSSAPSFALTTPGAGSGATISANFGASGVALGASTLTLTGANATPATYSGVISGSGGLIKNGAGVQVLGGANLYAGPTSVNNGVLVVNGSLAAQSAVNVAGGTLGGKGTINGSVTVQSGGTLSPGESPGKLTIGSGLALNGGGDYNWQVRDAGGAAGIGYDTVALTGSSLGLAGLSADNPFDINLWSLGSTLPDANGNAANFNSAQPQVWTLIATTTPINGFAADLFEINTAAANGTGGFTNALDGGEFDVVLSGDGTDLLLKFTPVPEPTALALIAAGVFAATRRRR